MADDLNDQDYVMEEAKVEEDEDEEVEVEEYEDEDEDEDEEEEDDAIEDEEVHEKVLAHNASGVSYEVTKNHPRDHTIFWTRSQSSKKFDNPPDRQSAPTLPGEAESSIHIPKGIEKPCKALWIGMKPKGEYHRTKPAKKLMGLETVRETDDALRVVVMLQPRKEGTAAQVKFYALMKGDSGIATPHTISTEDIFYFRQYSIDMPNPKPTKGVREKLKNWNAYIDSIRTNLAEGKAADVGIQPTVSNIPVAALEVTQAPIPTEDSLTNRIETALLMKEVAGDEATLNRLIEDLEQPFPELKHTLS